MFYGCFFTGTDGRYRDFIAVEAEFDEDAISCARASLVATSFGGFELWRDDRRIGTEPVASEPRAKSKKAKR